MRSSKFFSTDFPVSFSMMKPAKIKPSGLEVMVPIFVATGDKIEIDTRTGEYKNRVK